jgi:pantoate--beta-alanine ligase
MHISHTVSEWTRRRLEMKGQTIGLVPTMGALHAGHASLVERCRKENQIAVVTIFVNPTQFNSREDLDRYPLTLEKDLALLQSIGVDDVLAPAVADLYPDGYRFRVEAESVTDVMEGVYRPGFLQGVMTVVLKLLNLVRADRAYFGEKDYQQLKAVTEMAADFFIPTEIVPCPTVREESGLALSSRNALLSAAGREKAAAIFRILTAAETPSQARSALEAEGFAVDYVEEHWGRRFAAVFLERVRLIDNIRLTNHASLP